MNVFRSISAVLYILLSVLTTSGNCGSISSERYVYDEISDESADEIDHTAYSYDTLNRLVGSASSDGYDTSYSYDLNSAITAIVRKGLLSDRVTKGVVDDMTMTYDGNRLSEVDDAADRVTLESSLDYDGRSSEPFAYDASGRLIFYPGTDELSIKYAPNDMPVQMSSETATADYRYLADGRKLSRTLTASLTLSRSIKKRTTTCDVGSFRFTRGGTVGSPKLDRVTLPWGYFDKKLQANVYIKDYQGNIRAVYNQYSTTIIQQTDYYPYGLPKASSTGQEVNPFKYGGKELSTDLSLSYYDFEARMQLPALGIFQRPDPKAGEFPSINTYSYCAGDPVNRVDPDGKWNIEVSASKDRGRNPYAVLTATNRHGIPIFRTVVKVKGQFRERAKTYGDTPQGIYNIQNWNYQDDRHPVSSYGPNPFLRLWYTDGEGGSRQYMHLHGGGYGGEYQKTELKGTQGCIRISDEDIKTLKVITDYIEEHDPEEKGETLILEDNLESPVKYEDRIRISDIYNFRINLDELIVYPNEQ